MRPATRVAWVALAAVLTPVAVAAPAAARAHRQATAPYGATPSTGTTPSTSPGKRGTIRVPADAATIQAAVDEAAPGALVLVSPGVYKEAVTVTRPRIVIRGVDRNRTILDGEFRRDNGVKVMGADGVAIENLTARDYTGNGFFWTGVHGYRGSYLTAYRNGDYGIYAFGSVDGQIDHSYASGSPDSGFYIGQCRPCNAVITDVVSEYNELGYSGTNASGNLFIVRSVWRNNRAGIVPNTLDSEELPPQGSATIAGNLVYDNQSTKAATSPTEEFDAVYGVGIAVVGGVGDVVAKNRVLHQLRAGIVLAPNPAIQQNFWPAQKNQVRDNVIAGSGTADLGMLASSPKDGNCFSGNHFTTSGPAAIEKAAPCHGTGTGDYTTGAIDVAPYLDTSKNPPGTPYQHTPIPPKQRGMPNARRAKARPATHEPSLKISLRAVRLPAAP